MGCVGETLIVMYRVRERDRERESNISIYTKDQSGRKIEKKKKKRKIFFENSERAMSYFRIPGTRGKERRERSCFLFETLQSWGEVWDSSLRQKQNVLLLVYTPRKQKRTWYKMLFLFFAPAKQNPKNTFQEVRSSWPFSSGNTAI